jgi:hypothetical protein
VEKSSPTIWATSVIFNQQSSVNNYRLGEFWPYQVTLLVTLLSASLIKTVGSSTALACQRLQIRKASNRKVVTARSSGIQGCGFKPHQGNWQQYTNIKRVIKFKLEN